MATDLTRKDFIYATQRMDILREERESLMADRDRLKGVRESGDLSPEDRKLNIYVNGRLKTLATELESLKALRSEYKKSA